MMAAEDEANVVLKYDEQDEEGWLHCAKVRRTGRRRNENK